MPEDHPLHLDLTMCDGVPGDGADVLSHVEPYPQGECRWPAGACRQTAKNRYRPLRSLLSLTEALRDLVVQKKARRSSSAPSD